MTRAAVILMLAFVAGCAAKAGHEAGRDIQSPKSAIDSPSEVSGDDPDVDLTTQQGAVTYQGGDKTYGGDTRAGLWATAGLIGSNVSLIGLLALTILWSHRREMRRLTK